MKYDVVYENSSSLTYALEELNKEIRLRLLCGWELQGGVSITTYTSGNGSIYYVLVQAIVKK